MNVYSYANHTYQKPWYAQFLYDLCTALIRLFSEARFRVVNNYAQGNYGYFTSRQYDHYSLMNRKYMVKEDIGL